MNNVLIGVNGIKAFVYLDDTIMYATSIEDYEKKLIDGFNRLKKFNLKLQLSKCSFMRKKVNHSGHVITDESVKPDLQKIKCVLEFLTSCNLKQLKSFLGLPA